MAAVIRYRPVIFGDPPERGQVYAVWQEPDGRVIFRDMELPYRLEVSLEAVTPKDLPQYYVNLGISIEILPIREVSAATSQDAWMKMFQELAHVRRAPASLAA